MKKSLFLTCALASLLGIGALAGTLNATRVSAEEPQQIEEPKFTELSWMDRFGSNPGTYKINKEENTIVGSGNTGLRENFYITTVDALGDYRVDITFHGTLTSPVSKTAQIGIVPYFIDNSNFLLTYVEWSASSRPDQINEVEFTGRINNRAPYVFKNGTFLQSEWNDIWMDGPLASNSRPECNTSTFSVVKQNDPSSGAVKFSMFLDNVPLDSFLVRDPAKLASTPSQVGIYAYNDEVTFEDFKFTKLEGQDEWKLLQKDPKIVARSDNGEWESKKETDRIDTTSSTSLFNNMMVGPNEYKESIFRCSFTPEITSHDDNYGFGLIPNYKNDFDYFGAYVEKRGDTTYAKFNGKYIIKESNEIEYGIINKEIALDIDISEITSLAVEKRGYIFNILVNNEKVLSYANADLMSVDYMGLAAYGCNISFKNSSLAEGEYNPYDWYIRKANKSYFIQAASDDDDAITIAGSAYTFNRKSITENDATKLSSLYFDTSYYTVDMVVSVTSALSEDAVYGVYPWINSPEEYVSVVVSKTGVEAKIVTKNTEKKVTGELPTAYTIDKDEDTFRKMHVTIDAERKLTVELQTSKYKRTTVLTNVEIPFINYSTFANVGLIAANEPVCLDFETLTGTGSYSKNTIGKWTTSGKTPGSWIIDGEKSIKGIGSYGCAYMDDYAIQANPNVKNFYMGAEITVTNTRESEQKAALMPYYVDRSNYIIVMFSKWTVVQTGSIVITGRINGTVIGGIEWHDLPAAYTFEGHKNLLEVQLEDNHIRVFLNKGSTPLYDVEYEHVGDRNLANQSTGFFFFNDDVLFENYNLCSNTRVYTNDEKPVIEVYGSKKTTGTVNKAISLPVFAASNSVGDVLNPVVTVTDQNGQEVTLTNNKFTPTEAGIYHVKVTCVDSWGNNADPVEYDITVTEEGGGSSSSSMPSSSSSEEPISSSSSQGSSSQQGKKGGCTGSLIGGSAIIAVASLVGLGLLLTKKKEK